MNRRLSTSIFVSAGVITLLAIGLWPKPKHVPHLPFRKPNVPMPSVAERKRENENVIAKLHNDPRPESQDKVGTAEMRLAYLDAQSHDFEASRRQFLKAAKIKGTGVMGADFGGINDQAAYQAAVCLVAEHKEKEAKSAFHRFLTEFRMSPLVFAAEKRLVRLNNGTPDPNDEALLQHDIAEQETKVKFETAVCGPKTLEYLLRLGAVKARGLSQERANKAVFTMSSPTIKAVQPQPTGAPCESPLRDTPVRNGPGPNAKTQASANLADTPNYRQLAILCHTTEKGTSLAGIRSGLRKLGIQSYGLELNRQDFQKLPLPAIMLEGDHYFAILELHGRKLTVYDTRLNSKQVETLPEQNDPTWRATVIAFSLGDLTTADIAGGPPPKSTANPPVNSRPRPAALPKQRANLPQTQGRQTP